MIVTKLAQNNARDLRHFFAIISSVATAWAAAQTPSVSDINPGLKQAAPIPSNCPAGQHWTTLGSGIAHCVADDPVCLSPNTMQHDALGNPSCVAPVITYNTEYRTVKCSSGYTGSGKDQERKVTYTNGVPSYGSWKTVYNDCTAVPSAPPPAPQCPNGASDYPACTPPSSPPPVPPPTTPPPANPPCPNGASDYPVCTIPGPPPPPPTAGCPPDEYFCIIKRSYVDGTLQLQWGTYRYSGPSCSKTTDVAGAGRQLECPAPYN